jgi:hypothetical protein
MIVLQSPTKVLRPCPSGTFENSQQHARVIYGWVHRLQQTQSPAGTTETLNPRWLPILFILPNLCASAPQRFKKHDFAKRTQFLMQAAINQ